MDIWVLQQTYISIPLDRWLDGCVFKSTIIFLLRRTRKFTIAFGIDNKAMNQCASFATSILRESSGLRQEHPSCHPASSFEHPETSLQRKRSSHTHPSIVVVLHQKDKSKVGWILLRSIRCLVPTPTRKKRRTSTWCTSSKNAIRFVVLSVVELACLEIKRRMDPCADDCTF